MRNDNGQMAIFVALIFQVLFVAFAMAINIGLVVHDKINLQNSVDLAAYYAAQRQAEQLNVIAHQNYQIRQAFKLLAWRANVLGSAGRDDHPSRSPTASAEQMYANQPTVCIAYSPLIREAGGAEANSDNICKQREVNIPRIELPGVIAGFNPINIIFQQRVQSLIARLQNTCRGYGSFNFFLAAGSVAAFRNEQANRKQIIYGLARNMAKPLDGGMIDLDGVPVSAGVRNTLLKNLNYENGLSDVEIQMFNSLEGMAVENWLHELPINLNVIYTDIQEGGSEALCRSVFKPASQPPFRQDLGVGLIQELIDYVRGPAPGDVNQLSLGVEKNPWAMVYVGVKARTKHRQIFWPFGDGISFEATAYAQPFGGRIGPWYFSTWSAGARASSGTRVDPLTPPLTGAGAPENSFELLPNYSRFPGDTLGLHSASAHGAIPNLGNINGRFADYTSIADFGPNAPNDMLAFDPNIPGGGEIRRMEIAAIVPDLFDITYYSIEPRFDKIYLNKLVAIKNALGIPATVQIKGDIGSRVGTGSMGIFDQLKVANGEGAPSSPWRREAYWPVRQREHMLVDWVHGDSFEVQDSINTNRFGKCAQFDDDKVPTPGSCIEGGRTGYSVKIVSPEYLRSPDLELGGSGQRGPIMNPPPEGF